MFNSARIEKLFICFAVAIALLAGRLSYLQGYIGKELATLGLLSRVHELKLETARGEILDRNLQPLTNRVQRYNLTIFPSQLQNERSAAESLAKILSADPKELSARMQDAKRPFKLASGLTNAQVGEINALRLGGVIVDTETDRYSELASHAIGYANQTDNRGMSGIEGLFDSSLKIGEEQYLAALLDARASLIPGLNYKKIHFPAVKKSRSVVLTLDYAVQKAAEEVFDLYAEKGAVVVLEPASGKILAMVSRPNFNAEHLPLYLDDPDSPLLNRAITAYQTGSVFKMAVAAEALEKNLVKPEEQFIDKGYIDVDGTIFRGWDYKRGARAIDFTDAMAYSSNPVFIEVGLRIGMKNLVAFSQSLGFGKRIGLTNEEMPGHLPDADNIYRGETANLSIGQGECEATPVQIASLLQTIVNDGVQITPSLVEKIIDEDGAAVETVGPPKSSRKFSAQTARAVKKMLVAVNAYGTGQAAYVEQGGSAGKTGTAETGRLSKKGEGISHAWYAGYAPVERPAYIVVVFIEEGMSGGDVAAPIFREIVERIAK